MSGMMMGGMTPAMIAINSYAEERAHFLIDTQFGDDEVLRWTVPAGDYPLAQSMFDYANALAALHRGDLAGAREAISRVESGGQRSVAWFIEQHMDHPMIHDVVLIYNGELHALLTAAEGKPQDAVTELQHMAAKEHGMALEFGPPNIEKPTDELLGELLLQLNRPAEARNAFQAALARTPGRNLVVEALARTDKEIAAKEGIQQPSANGPAHKH
jgi:predicted Zn-dependent protease